MFEEAILKVEGNDICGNDAIKIVKDLQNELQNQIDASYISIEVEQALHELCQTDPTVDEVDLIENTACSLYRKFT